MQEPLLAINHLSIERGERLLFSDYSMALASGEIVQIEGANGAGKTTLMRTIAGLLEPIEADIFWRGEQVNRAEAFSDEVLYLGHKPAIRYQLTPLENLRWYSQVHQQQSKDVDDAGLLEALRALGLSGYEDELCSQLSAGQKRRVGLARLAISSAPLWILDEPFTAVDVAGVKTLVSWIEDFASKGGCVLFTTHQKVEFQSLFPRIIDLSKENRANESNTDEGAV